MSKPGFSVFVCGRRGERVKCSSHDCTRLAEAKCQAPVKVHGQEAECLRPVCRGCVAVTAEGKTLCGAHGRALGKVTG